MNEYDKINYVFHVQNPEDFYAQLRAFERNDYLNELEVDLNDLSIAQSMLKSIGVPIHK
jgi:hypothetical protein